MQYRQGVFKTRAVSWLTLLVFTMLSVMPFPGYAQQVSWDELRSQGLMVSDQLDDEGYRLITTDANRTVSLTAFDQGLTDKWKFNLGGNNLNFNITGDAATTWSGTTNVLNGILGLFNSHGIHFTETSKINLTNAGFIGAAMHAVDGTSFNNLKLAGNGYLLSEGKISGGNIALLGGTVENKGAIEAPLNQVTIAGGKAMTVGLSGDNLISVVVDEATDTKVKDFDGKNLTDQIKDSGNIKAHKIKLDAKGVDGVFEKAINLTGEIQATNVNVNDKGEVELVAIGGIYNSGTIDSAKTTEHGYTFKNTGTLKGGVVLMDNTDGAADISGTVSSNLSDTGDINLVGNVTLGANVVLTADSDANGTGKITFSDGVSLSGSGSHYNLTLKASGQSIIRSMDDLGDLILTAQTAGAQFTLRHAIDMEGDLTVNEGATLDGAYSVTVRGGSVIGDGDINLTGGTFQVIGGGSFGGAQDWSFYDLMFGDGTTAGTTTKEGSNLIRITHQLRNRLSHELKAGSSLWNLDWGGGVLTDVVKIATGKSHTLALIGGTGAVYSWGDNSAGQLGNTDALGSSIVPMRVMGGASGNTYLINMKDIAANQESSYAVGLDGYVYAWGGNFYGQLGDGTTTTRSTPIKVLGGASGDTYLSNVDSIWTGPESYSVLAITKKNEQDPDAVNSQQVYAWGSNRWGVLGDNTYVNRSAPVKSLGGATGNQYLRGISQIALGGSWTEGEFALVLQESNGQVFSFGVGSLGQLGNGDYVAHKTPVAVAGGDTGDTFLTGVTKIAAGIGHGVALREDGNVYTWGDNYYGQLGNSQPGVHRDTVEIGSHWGIISTYWIDVPIYESQPIILTRDVYDDDGNWIGTEDYISGYEDVLIGYNSVEQYDHGWITDYGLTDPIRNHYYTPTYAFSGAKDIAAGGYRTYAVDVNGASYQAGGDAVAEDSFQSNFQQLESALVTTDQIYSNGYSHFFIKDGSLSSSGFNDWGQLGIGASPYIVVNKAIQVLNPEGWKKTALKDIFQVSGGETFALAIAGFDHQVYAWGRNDYGQLGDGTNYDSLAPTRVLGKDSQGNSYYLNGISKVSAGSAHALALSESDGQVFSWGYGSGGLLGLGNNSNSNYAQKVLSGAAGGGAYLNGVSDISAGSQLSLAVRESDGQVFSWGANQFGQLGNRSSSAYSNVAVKVMVGSTGDEGLDGVSQVSAGDYFALALRSSDGSVWSWGSNRLGSLGDDGVSQNSDVGRNFAGHVLGGESGSQYLTGVSKISAGSVHALALMESDQSVLVWGNQGVWWLYADDTQLTPAYVRDQSNNIITGVSDISAGGGYSLFSKNSFLYSWSGFAGGALGRSDGNNWQTPLKVVGGESGDDFLKVDSFSAGFYSGYAVNPESRELYAWGGNSWGQLGNQLLTDTNLPGKTVQPLFAPFVNEGTFDAQDSTFYYSGDYAFGTYRDSLIEIDDSIIFNNLTLKYTESNYLLNAQNLTVANLKNITKGRLVVQSEVKKTPDVDVSDLFPDTDLRVAEIAQLFSTGQVNPIEIFKFIFSQKRAEMRMQELKTGVNNFEVTPQDLGMDQGIDQFQKMIFDAETQPEDERKVLDSEKQTDTVLATVTGNARVVASDGKIYEAKPGMPLAKGDQVWTDNSAKVELSNKGDVVTVNSGSAVVVASAPAAANDSNVVNAGESAPVQDLLQIAFGKVSVAVSGEDSQSSFVVQTPNGMSGLRG